MIKDNNLIGRIKRMDNGMTFAIGYRNLFNIVVLSIGFVMLFYAITALQVATGWIITLLGLKWALTQMRENVDAIQIEEIVDSGDGTTN